MKRPAAALGSDGHVYVNIYELFDAATCAKVRRRISALVHGRVLVAVRMDGVVTQDAIKRLDDAVAEAVAARRG